ncbi:uncharacterized protein BJX67DRAFT_181816 [Aspergillus lucknowensis]|uniref:Uncharacterized protein n=1 Tax=Aspergillus lucknowensis TaxID=176173 RepID=A0ABR4LPN4_9EURO
MIGLEPETDTSQPQKQHEDTKKQASKVQRVGHTVKILLLETTNLDALKEGKSTKESIPRQAVTASTPRRLDCRPPAGNTLLPTPQPFALTIAQRHALLAFVCISNISHLSSHRILPLYCVLAAVSHGTFLLPSFFCYLLQAYRLYLRSTAVQRPPL